MSLYANAQSVTLSGGQRLCVAQFAPCEPSARRRIVLLHGNPSHIDHWIATLPALRRHGAVLAFDQPGFGRSEDFSDARPTLERSARVVCELMDALSWHAAVHLVGQSHGGIIAIALAALAPERVASVSVLGTGGTPAHAAYRLLAAPGLDRALYTAGARFFRSAACARLARQVVAYCARDSFAPDPVPAAFVEEEVRLFAARPETLRAMARLVHDDPCRKLASYAEQVTRPVLFVHGSSDALVPVRYARRVHDILRARSNRSRFVEVPGGHMVHLTHPELVNPLLDDWISSGASLGSR